MQYEEDEAAEATIEAEDGTEAEAEHERIRGGSKLVLEEGTEDVAHDQDEQEDDEPPGATAIEEDKTVADEDDDTQEGAGPANE